MAIPAWARICETFGSSSITVSPPNEIHIIVAAALAVFAIVATVVLCTAPELALAKLIGKAAWYVPYAALVGAVKAVRFGV